jgi:hypothetical protein
VRVAAVMSSESTIDDSVMVDRFGTVLGIDHGLI